MAAPEYDVLFGRNAVAAALAGQRLHRRLLVGQGVREDERIQSILRASRSAGIRIDRVAGDELDQITRFANHQGVALETSTYQYASIETLTDEPGSNPTIVALDHLQDPQNVGTLIRAAVAFQATGMILPKDRAASITPAVVNASAGSTEQLRIARVTNLATTLDRLRDQGWWTAGLDQGEGSTPLPTTVIPLPVVVVIGAEGSGLSELVRKKCDLRVEIPTPGPAESLNAATAGAIALYEIRRQSGV